MFSLGIVSDTVSGDFAYATAQAAAWGISNVEIFSVWNRPVIELTDDEVRELGSLATDADVTISNLATLIMRCPATPEARDEQLAQFERAVQIASLLELDRIRCYAFLKEPDLEGVWDFIVASLSTLLERAEAAGITLLLENSSYANVQMATESRRLLDALPNPRLQLLWDAGNAFALGDPTPTVEAWDLLKDRIAHIHLKDSITHGSNEWTPLGEGAFDLDGLLAALERDHYAGIVSLETYFNDDDPAERERKTHRSVMNLKDRLGVTAQTRG